ncbi:MAG: hypothetical protein ACE14V_11075 [bacterium]
MFDQETGVQLLDYKDRKIGLVIFGILEIILGAICALAVPMMIFGMIVSSTMNKSSDMPPMNASMLIPGMLVYILAAVWFIWMGIGSIKARRWARALILVTSWIWLICGIAGFFAMVVLMPNMYAQMAQKQPIPPEMVTIMQFVTFGFMAIVYILIPGALVLFYGSRHVKATCEFCDPQVRWTDKCPLPVLAISLMAGFGAVSMILMGFYGWVVPFFGVILTGIAGAGVALVSMVLLGYIAWGTYKLDMKAWWIMVLMTIIWTISAGITFSRVSLWEFYEKMNFPQQQLELMKQIDLPTYTIALFYGVWILGFLGYLLYIRKYFLVPSNKQ